MASPQVESVVGRLKAQGRNPRPSGKGWQAKCPAHDDHKPSLSVNEGTEGRALVKCHAGCEYSAIISAIGLERKDLISSKTAPKKIAATYDYRDANGQLIYQTVRYEPKGFSQRRPNGNGGWIWNLNGTDRPLYRLPELIEDAGMDRRIYVVEGEKGVDGLRAESLAATCNVGGAGKWRDEYSESLKGVRVCILPDNDDPGKAHAEKVANSLQGIASEVKVVLLPRLPKKGDVSDWMANGGTPERLEELVDATACWEPDATQALTSPAVLGVNDLFHATQIAYHFGENIRYCKKLGGFFVWDGKRWAEDDTGQLWRWAVETTVKEFVAAGDIDDDDRRTRIKTWAVSAERRNNIENAIKHLRHQEKIAVRHTVFDTDLWLLNCVNGTIDLRTGELEPHRQEAMMTKLAPVEYDPTAECPQWMQFLDDIAAGNKGLIAYLQRLAGYCLTGDTREQKFFFLYGTGQNGKSTFLDTLMYVMGDYAQPTASDLLLAHRDDTHPTGMADLKGLRLAVTPEVEQGKRIAEVRVKELTGMTSSKSVIKARKMHQNNFTFTATHKLIMAGNHKPIIRGTDEGIWRRIHLIPFTVKIEQPDNMLPDKLLSEAPGILRWCVEGCREWQKLGLLEPGEVIEATKVYRTEMDVLAEFIDECCVVERNASVTTGAIYAAFRVWCTQNGEHEMSQKKFSMTLKRQEFTQTVSSGKRIWHGIGLLAIGRTDE